MRIKFSVNSHLPFCSISNKPFVLFLISNVLFLISNVLFLINNVLFLINK